MTDQILPRLMGRKEAADYLGIAPSTLSMWVATHKIPGPIPGTNMWDRKAIDAKLDDISGLTVRDTEDDYEKLNRDRRPGSGAAVSDYETWHQGKLKRREKYRPKLGLDFKLERVLRHMADHPDCETVDLIPGAGPSVMEKLVEAGAVRVVSMTGKLFRYGITEKGKDELHRLKKWKSLSP